MACRGFFERLLLLSDRGFGRGGGVGGTQVGCNGVVKQRRLVDSDRDCGVRRVGYCLPVVVSFDAVIHSLASSLRAGQGVMLGELVCGTQLLPGLADHRCGVDFHSRVHGFSRPAHYAEALVCWL